MDIDARISDFVAAHLAARGLAPLCLVCDRDRGAILAADGDDLVVVLLEFDPSADRRHGPGLRVDRVTVLCAGGEPAALDHEEALARWPRDS